MFKPANAIFRKNTDTNEYILYTQCSSKYAQIKSQLQQQAVKTVTIELLNLYRCGTQFYAQHTTPSGKKHIEIPHG
jgi:hypothetical protein